MSSTAARSAFARETAVEPDGRVPGRYRASLSKDWCAPDVTVVRRGRSLSHLGATVRSVGDEAGHALVAYGTQQMLFLFPDGPPPPEQRRPPRRA